VTDDRILEVTGHAKHFLEDSFLENAPIIPVSAVDGNGIDDLKKALMALGEEVGTRHDSGIFRMPVDRVFTMRGFGTVIAGTILSGKVSEGDKVEIFPDGIVGKVRGVQVHHRKVARSLLGKRTALNLQDVKKELLKRGQCAGEPGSLSTTFRLDANLRLLKSYGKNLKNRTRIRLHVGTAEIISRLVLLEGDVLLPGQEALVQFVLESPTVALPGDRFVIRTFSPLMTIGGGEILDSTPTKHKRFDDKTVEGLQRLGGDLTERVNQVLLDVKTLPLALSEMRKKVGEKEEALEDALRSLEEDREIIKIKGHKETKYLHKRFYVKLEDASKSLVKEYLEKNPHRLAMPYEELRSKILEMTDNMTFKTIIDSLVETGILQRKNADVSLVGYESRLKPKDQENLRRIEQDFQRKGFASPIEEELRQKMGLTTKEFKNLMYNLQERGILVRLSDKVVYHRDAVDRARQVVLQYLEKYPSITVAELRDVLQLSRKYATAILEYFDRIGLTKRDKDVHILR
jgi:selenocysteine-specific elongation factor